MTRLDQSTLDAINEAHSDANDIDGFHAQNFANELAKRGLCIVPAAEISQADGFIVVSTWLPGKYASTRHTYDHYTKLEDAVAYYRALSAGAIRDYAPKGIYAAADGLPIGGPLALTAMAAVEPVLFKMPGGAAQSTPENRMLLENAIYNGMRVP